MYGRTGTITRGCVLRSLLFDVARLCGGLVLYYFPLGCFFGGDLAWAWHFRAVGAETNWSVFGPEQDKPLKIEILPDRSSAFGTLTMTRGLKLKCRSIYFIPCALHVCIEYGNVCLGVAVSGPQS